MIYIGVDPDIDKNGVAVYDTQDNSLELSNLSFWDLIEEIESYLVPITVIIESGHLISKSNWHGAKTKSTAAKIGKNVGANHQVGRLLIEYCEHNGIKYKAVEPKGKIKAKIFNHIWRISKRTNQEQRDAAMLLISYK